MMCNCVCVVSGGVHHCRRSAPSWNQLTCVSLHLPYVLLHWWCTSHSFGLVPVLWEDVERLFQGSVRFIVSMFQDVWLSLVTQHETNHQHPSLVVLYDTGMQWLWRYIHCMFQGWISFIFLSKFPQLISSERAVMVQNPFWWKN